MSRATSPRSHQDAADPKDGIRGALAVERIEFDPWTVLAFLYPLSQLIVFDLVGQLYLLDILALPMLALLLTLSDAGDRLYRLRVFFIFMGLWLLGQVLTDLVRGTVPSDYLRGWSRIVFLGLHVCVLWLWLPRRRSYMIAFAIGLGIASAYNIPEEFIKDAWKFGYDKALVYCSLGLLLVIALRYRRIQYLIPAVLALLSLYILLQGARASFAIALFSSAVAAFVLFVTPFKEWRRKLNFGGFAIILVGGAAVIWGATFTYTAAAENGWLGREAYLKYRDQTSGEVPLILGGRTESLVSVRAIADSPVLGHGSWARDARYVALHHSIKVELGLPIFDAQKGKRDLIPSHSYLLGSWVEAGVLGGLFWLFVLSLPFATLFQLLKREEVLAPLIAYCSFALIWSVLFSPFSGSERFLVSFQLVVLFWFLRTGAISVSVFAPLRGKQRGAQGLAG
ncbi:hypothetical protein [Parerythrobacter jejuensis]|uniref:O-antigen ligase domain-containing protein n=1 Tax=Parerythrobacter jejuensis TaxID=795812 RepID=A0A845APZ8_9SPHN|nr:hypothetical protein [Parerythrobacter jejuensis]MXP32922.1 hypothetical protein [Parerythrobacter jejuensis]